MSVVRAIRIIDSIGQDIEPLTKFPYWQDRLIASYTTRSFAVSAGVRRDVKHFIPIDQAPTNELAGGAKVKDVEPGGAGLENAKRLRSAGEHFVTYTFEANMTAARDALPGGPFWVADWNLTEAEALQYLADHPDTVAVQWASPTSNPGLVVPGTNGRTIRELNVDLSVGKLSYWMPGKPAPKPDHGAEGLWQARITWDAKTDVASIEPLPGANVKLSTKAGPSMIREITTDLHTGRWDIHKILGHR